MDPLTLILTALVTGATKAAGEAVPDAYKGFKTLIQKKFAGKPEAEIALAKHEEKPKVWEEPLKEALAEAGVDKDEDIINAAQELMKILDPQGTAMGTYTINVSGNVYGVAGRNEGTVNQTFNK
jgi:hypothetical protein